MTSHELEDENAQRPPINSIGMTSRSASEKPPQLQQQNQERPRGRAPFPRTKQLKSIGSKRRGLVPLGPRQVTQNNQLEIEIETETLHRSVLLPTYSRFGRSPFMGPLGFRIDMMVTGQRPNDRLGDWVQLDPRKYCDLVR